MKHRIRNSIIWIIGHTGPAWLYRLYLRRKGPLVRVLCFHDVPDRQWFEDVISMLIKNYHVISPEQFQRNDFHSTKISILLTFDDGYQSWVDVCLPVLTKYSLQGLFFINSGLLNIAHDAGAVKRYMHEQLLLSNVRQPLTWEGAKVLHAAGNSFGGHTVSHVRASGVSEAEWDREVASDKETIESNLGITLTDFAFPFGGVNDYSPKAIEVCKKNGYLNTYSAISGFTKAGDTPTPRLLIEANQKLQSVHSWIMGGYDIFSVCLRIIK